MKNDPIVGRIMSGMSDNDIIKYMMRDLQQRGNFSDFYRLAAERAIARKDRTPDLSTNGAIEILNDSKAVVDNLVPDKVIQKKIIDDREIFTAKKAESLLKGQEVPTLDISLDSLPGMLSLSDIALGSQYFRFYDLRQALAVTQAGQLSIRWIENKLNEYMNNILKTEGNDYVIASDTDSIYLRLGELVNSVYEKEGRDNQKIIAFMDKVCEAKIQPFIDRAYLDLANYVRAHAQKMIMKREALADKGLWTAKKRYALNVYNNEGVAYKEPKLKVMGLEMVKSSTPSVIRVKMREVLKLMMTGTEEDVYKFIEDFKIEFMN